MSLVTNVLVHARYLTAETMAALLAPISGAQGLGRLQPLGQDVTDGFGGYKVMESDVFTGAALNFVSTYAVQDWFTALPWQRGDEAALTAFGESDGDVVVVVVTGGRPLVVRPGDGLGAQAESAAVDCRAHGSPWSPCIEHA